MSNQRFLQQLTKFTKGAKQSLHDITRIVVMDCAVEIVERSPVGNPELWAINDTARGNRITYNISRSEGGMRQLSNRSLMRMFPSSGPKGYVGGRFRGNWQYGENVIPSGSLPTIDPSGAASIARFNRISPQAGGKIHYIANNLPYALRLEQGWSKQAPSGMVALTVQRFNSIVNSAAARVRR